MRSNASLIGSRGWCALAAVIAQVLTTPAHAQDFWKHGDEHMEQLEKPQDGSFALGTGRVTGSAAQAAAELPLLSVGAPSPAEAPKLNYRGRPSAGAAPIRYFEDFAGDVGPEWSMGRVSAMSPFGRFAGPFRASTQELSVLVEPGEPLMVGYDLYIVGSVEANRSASDLFKVLVDGVPVFEATLADLQEKHRNLNADKANYDPRLLIGMIALFVPEHPVAEIEFIVEESGERGGESWGIDNVLVDHAPDEIESALGILEHGKYRDPMWGGGGGGGGAAAAAPNYGGGGGSGGGGGGGGPSKFDPFTPVTGPEIDPPGTDDPDDPDDPDDTEPTPPEVPTPGSALLLVMAGGTAMRRKRPGC